LTVKKRLCYRSENPHTAQGFRFYLERIVNRKIVITGFNTDIEHEGVVYHVQTEDKGLNSPMILSLVYVGGTILASKRTPYKDLIAKGFSDEALSERLSRQHRLICAAIHAGRVNDLKKMSGRGLETPVTPVVEATIEMDESQYEQVPDDEVIVVGEADYALVPDEEIIILGGAQYEIFAPPPEPPVSAQIESAEDGAASLDSAQPQPDAISAQDPVSEMPAIESATTEEGLVVVLLDAQELYSGDTPTLRVLVIDRSGEVEKPLGDAAVSIKILATTFRPLIYSLKTEVDGIATASVEIPHFISGRAAVLIRAVAKGSEAELRRVIHPKMRS